MIKLKSNLYGRKNPKGENLPTPPLMYIQQALCDSFAGRNLHVHASLDINLYLKYNPRRLEFDSL